MTTEEHKKLTEERQKLIISIYKSLKGKSYNQVIYILDEVTSMAKNGCKIT